MTTTTTTNVCVGKCLTLVEQAAHSSIGGALVLCVGLLCLTAIVVAALKWVF